MSNKNNKTNLIAIKHNVAMYSDYKAIWFLSSYQGIDSNAWLKQVVHSKVRIIKTGLIST